MIDFKVCLRCNGDVLEYFPADSERALYINCGWRPRTYPRTYPSRSRLTRGCVTSKTANKCDESGSRSA